MLVVYIQANTKCAIRFHCSQLHQSMHLHMQAAGSKVDQRSGRNKQDAITQTHTNARIATMQQHSYGSRALRCDRPICPAGLLQTGILQPVCCAVCVCCVCVETDCSCHEMRKRSVLQMRSRPVSARSSSTHLPKGCGGCASAEKNVRSPKEGTGFLLWSSVHT